MKYYSAIVIQSRYDSRYLLEWILYYKHIFQIDHIYFYDNGAHNVDESVEVQKVLKPFVDSGFISYIEWGLDTDYKFTDPHMLKHNTERHLMWCAYDRTIKLKECKWLIGIDSDEFILINDKYKNINEYLQTIDYSKVKAIYLFDKLFGHNNFKLPKYNLLTENYVLCKDDKTYMKSIVNTSLHNYCGSVHNWGIYDIFKNKECMKSEDLIIHHYFSKSEYEWFRSVTEREKSIEESKKYKNLFKRCFIASQANNDNKNRLIVNKSYRNPHIDDSNKDYNDNMKKYCSKIKKEIDLIFYGKDYINYVENNKEYLDFVSKLERINKIIENKNYFIYDEALLGSFRNNNILDKRLKICIAFEKDENIEDLKDFDIIDFSTYTVENNKVIILNNNDKLSKEEVFPINEIKFCNLFWKCPVQVYEILSKKFNVFDYFNNQTE